MGYNHIFPALVIGSFTLFSCGDSSVEKEPEKPSEPYKLEFFETSAFEEGCSHRDSCTYVWMNIPAIEGGWDQASTAINNSIDSLVREMMKSRLPEPKGNVPLDVLAQSFIEGYELFLIEFPDTENTWYIEMKGDSSVLGEDYFSLRMEISEFLGGAHPSSFTLLKTYDLENGNFLDPLAKLDRGKVMAQAEAKFRGMHDLAPGDNLNDAGFLFEEGKFTLPENMALTPQGLLLVYNSYEVASYAEGATTILLPFAPISREEVASK